MRQIVISLITLTSLLLFSRPAAAANGDILINEFSSADNPEWVELYNDGASEVTLEGWSILFQDNPDTTQKIILGANDILSPGGFKVIERTYTGTSAWLRNDGDTIIIKDSQGSEKDSVKYGDVADASIQAPTSGQSAGRSVDGTGEWLIFSTPTKGSTNNSSTPVPSPSPSPSPTPTPTSSVQSSSPKSPSPTPKASSAQTVPTPSPTAKKSPQILGVESTISSTLQSSLTKSPSPTPAPKVGSPKTKIAAIATGSGAILIGLSIGFYLWYKRVLTESGKDQNKD